MKKIIFSFLTLFVGLTLTHCTPFDMPKVVLGVKLSQSTAMVHPGGTLDLTVSVAPPDAANYKVGWSSNSLYATVTSTGDHAAKVTVSSTAPIGTQVTIGAAVGDKWDICILTVVPHPSTPSISMTAPSSVSFNATASDAVIVIWPNGSVQSFSAGTLMASSPSDDAGVITIYGNIGTLDCANNALTALNFSNCTHLSFLKCNDNKLKTLNVNGCSALNYLYCHKNQLETLTGCNALFTLAISDNQLKSVDVSKCTELDMLFCERNLFDSASLDALFGMLCDRQTKPYKGQIHIKGNPGVSSCHPTIAEEKRWTVFAD